MVHPLSGMDDPTTATKAETNKNDDILVSLMVQHQKNQSAAVGKSGTVLTTKAVAAFRARQSFAFSKGVARYRMHPMRTR